MRTRFDAELESLYVDMIKMGALSEDALSKLAAALGSDDRSMLGAVAEVSRQIDEKEREIEALCLRLLLRRQPVAKDLRTISSAMKMVGDIERIGDNAADIAETAYSRVLVARSEDYTLSAIGLGKGRVDVYLHHILPAIMPYIAKQAVSIFSASILSEASLSFLGCGVPVTIPTLGSMLSEARPVMGQAPWLVAFPALFLFLIGLSLELLASGRSELDPSSH